MIDQETYQGWLEASRKETVNLHIHPAGKDLESYTKSGEDDAKRVLEYLKGGELVMDYGCGNGRVMQFLTNCIGVDAVRYGDWTIKPEEFTGKVDVIYSISVFIHNSYESGCKIIQWMKDHINEGGLLLLQIPIYDEPKNPLNWTDVGVWTERMFRDAVEGLEIVELHTNPGAFNFESIGANHHKFQILRK